MVAEAGRQLAEVEEIVASRSPEELLRRPDPVKWSVAGHVAHMCLVNESYLTAIEERIRSARASGAVGRDGPYRHPRFASWFARSMEPPPKRRIKTLKSMVPDPVIDSDDVVDRFRSTQRRLVDALERSRGLDLGRVRFGSPFVGLVRLSLGTGLALLLAHNRRHIWLIEEVLGEDGAP